MHFRIVNVDKKEIVQVDESYTPDDMLLKGSANPLVALLTVPNLKRVGISQSGVDRARALNRSSPLVALPQELVNAITDEVSDLCPLLSLAVTCSYFWRTLLPRVREAIIAYEAPWAGDRLVFVSERSFGLPPSCSGFKHDDEARNWLCRCPLYHIETTAKEPLGFGNLFHPNPRGQTPPFMPIFSIEDYELYYRLRGMLKYGTTRRGVLRNLSKRQYVLDATLERSKWQHSLGQAITIRSQWTEDLFEYGNSEWAGDRFDIRTVDNITSEWIDKTDETVDLLNAATENAILSVHLSNYVCRAWIN
ncbi:hypothetical protein F4680DRAFT_452799 [Xylaria scruposa]|nr:hypothetical protein F4680DRAFT_452799 [Xylaria scruposa]